MDKKMAIYGKAQPKFYYLTENILSDIWDFEAIKKSKKIDFIKQYNYKLEEDEIFFIKSNGDELDEIIENIKNTTNCDSINKEQLEKLDFIYVFKREKIELYIQRVMKANRLKKNWLSFNDKASIEKNKTNIAIQDKTDIFWSEEEQKIYFKKFTDLENVFPNFSKYYREANKEDCKKLKEDFDFLDITIDLDEITQKTTKQKIAKIVDELGRIGDFKLYMEYVSKYTSNILKNGKLGISNKEDINTLENIVFRKYFTTEVGDKEMRIANSFKLINK